MADLIHLSEILNELTSHHAVLVAVSKTQPIETIKEVYDFGHKIFGENYVQELIDKQARLPKDIQWHFIGHLQTNKVKMIAPFITLIESVDSLKLLKEIDKEGKKNNRVINCLLQVYIAQEETKSGLSFREAEELLQSNVLSELKHVSVKGFMGMATLTNDQQQIRNEFRSLKTFFEEIESRRLSTVDCRLLSMGMTSDYKIALEEGSNMVRIGSAIFGQRNKSV
jgi:pyridoxal phosphate enzyme (YggS family)